MSDASEKIPFSVEIGRMIEVLAAQIYPTPFALLRENVQNAYDAILLRRHFGQPFEPAIEVTIEPQQISVRDNGIGMSRSDLREHFWRAGSSSKNTDEARAAGVVGTFGIGAMANFGIAEELVVETESVVTGERTRCSAARSTLSVTEDCITFEEREPEGEPGTQVWAIMQPDKAIDVAKAESYISQFVAYLPINVLVNGKEVSGNALAGAVPSLTKTWAWNAADSDLGGGYKADVELNGAINGEVRIALTNIRSGDQSLEGELVLRQGLGNLQTFRSGFGLATVSVSSTYNLGGVADFLFLQPTAGREALTTDSMQVLQDITTRVDELISLRLADRPESNANSHFVAWASRHKRYDLCSHLRVRVEPGDSLTLDAAKERSQTSPFLVYAGNDSAVIGHGSEDTPILILSRGSPRRECELNYLRKYCRIEELSDEPRVLKEKPENEASGPEKALAFRVASILSSDYFLDVHVRYAEISHGLPVLVAKNEPPIQIYLDPSGKSVQLLLQVYDKEYPAFGHMAKDFVRTMIFPKVSTLVPSATRQGAEAFLKSIHRSREIFEYESSDWESLSSLWKDYLGGKLTFQQATERSNRVAARSYQVIDRSVAGAVRDIVPDAVNNEAAAQPPDEPHFGALPPIQRLDMRTDKKLLTIDDGQPSLKGYRCFIAITDRVRDEKGDFFLQPHRTSVVWGGQKALFIFEHHSGEFGLYYDLQTQSLVADQSGGGSFETCTIVMKNRVFIPVPESVKSSFLPLENEKKRFEVRCDILHTDHHIHDSA